ncbi:HIT-like domain containing protein [Elaphomyces granulatus]
MADSGSEAEIPEASETPSPQSLTKTTTRNAFTELMQSSRNRKSKPAEDTSSRMISKNNPLFKSRDALGEYIEKPESFPPSIVVYYNDDFVAIHDRFPKSSLHLLLLPRDSSKTWMHPFDAFRDADFLRKVQAEVKKLRTLAASELRRRYGKESIQEKVREEAMEADPPPDELPPGRDWGREIMSGIHAHPSMNHLHVHVISKDRYSDRLKHRKHYNSFATPFFIDVDDLPLAEDDARNHPGREGYLKRDFICWRCGRNYGNKFRELKNHLGKEFEEWRKV